MLSVNVLLSVSCESMCICRQELLFLALARHFHLIEVQGSEGLGEDPPHSLSSPRLQHKFIVEMRMHMLIPKSIQTLFGNGDSPYGNIRLSLPISVRGLPIWKWGAYFWRPPSHALKSIFPQILDRKSKFSWKSPFPYGDPRFHIGI